MSAGIEVNTAKFSQDDLYALGELIIRVATCSPHISVCEKALDVLQDKLSAEVVVTNSMFNINDNKSDIPVKGSDYEPQQETKRASYYPKSW